MNPPFHEQIEEIERVADELHWLLSHNAGALRHNGMHGQACGLAGWVECYRRGLHQGLLNSDDNANMTHHSNAWLSGVGDRLKLESETPYGHDDDTITIESENEIINSVRRCEVKNFMESARRISRLTPYANEQHIFQGEPIMPQTRVKDLMKKNPVIIEADATLKEAAQKMESTNCGMLPVGGADGLEGVITDRDIVLRAVAKGKNINTERVRDYMTAGVCTINIEDTADHAASVMHQNEVNRVIVENEKGEPCGVLSFGRIIRENENMDEVTTFIECAVGRKAA